MMKHLITTLLYLGLFLLAIWAAGCCQRECTYDPTTGIVHYKSNHLATDTSADYVKVTAPNGIIIEFNKFSQDNDSMLVWTPWGMMETNK